MSYNPELIYKTIMDVVVEAVGDELSVLGSPPNAKPALFKGRAAGNAPTKLSGLVPFGVVTLGPKQRHGTRSLNRWYNDEGGLVTEILYDVICTLSFYGGDCSLICSTAEEYFLTQSATEALLSNDIVVKDSTGVVPTTTVLDDTPQDFASTNLVLTITNQLVEDVYDINLVDVNLNLRYPESEDNIVSHNITIP